MKLFVTLFAIAAVTALVVLYFFFIGLVDGSVSSFNMHLWVTILGVLAIVLGFGWLLNARGHRWQANLMLLIVAVPGFLYGLFVLLVIVMQPNWR